MSIKSITAWSIIVILAIALTGGVWWYASTQQMQSGTPTTSAKSNSVKPAVGDTSDAALDADLSTIDGQMQDMNSDSASVTQSLQQNQ